MEQRERSLSFPTLIFLVICSADAAAFDINYRYELTDGKKLEVCSHMLGVYNKHFRKPWDVTAQKKDDAEEFWETRYSKYPTSPEFDAIQWTTHRYKHNSASNTALYSEFDIDNDGVQDLVVRVGFFRGSPGSWDYIWVFSKGTVDLSQFRTHADFVQRIAPKRKASLGYPAHERPFIYRGRTYIHGYVYTPRTSPGTSASEPFAPPEYLLINEYVGGPATDAEEQARSKSMKLVCRYKMIQQVQR